MLEHVSEAAVLQLLRIKPDHGYALFTRLVELQVETPEADKTRTYRILRSLEKAGFVAATWDTSQGGKGPARKVYKLTRSGERHRLSVLLDLESQIKLATAVVNLAL